MKNVINLISAFAVTGVIIGIFINIFSDDGSALHEFGMGLVIAAGIVAVVFQIIIRFMRRRDGDEFPDDQDDDLTR